MTLLFRILRAAHARGTHHKLALDALTQLSGPDSERWRRLFLEHAALYMEGSKAPDNEFKDFKNHVLHVRDGYWGGAADKVEAWYANLLEALKAGRWSEAVWAAGVLSHYYTDPIHPFHTGQTEAENNIHRAVEWSINRSYDDLVRQGVKAHGGGRAMPGEGAGWLKAFVADGAEFSNRYYETLIAHYDINKGVTDPPAGLDAVAKGVVGELLHYATTGFAAVLDRAFAEAAVSPPDVNLTLDTVMAALQMPLKSLLKRMDDAQDRRLIERMYDELKTTGRVEVHLPEDDRMVREAFAREVLAPRAELQAKDRARMLAQSSSGQPSPVARRVANGASQAPAAPASGSSGAGPAGDRGMAGKASGGDRSPVVADDADARALSRLQPRETSVPVVQPMPDAVEPRDSRVHVLGSVPSVGRPPRIHLALEDDVERAPSIGPKTAERLYAIGIRTVEDLLHADAEGVAADLDVRHISVDVVESWKDQCRLVMDVPGLRGTHAQILVGAGYRDAAALAAAQADDLASAVLRFAASSDGQRVLREGSPPDMEKITGWIAAARSMAA